MSIREQSTLLDPEEQGLDDETRQRRRLLVKLRAMSVDEVRQLAVRAGIYAEDGELTEPYRAEASPSASRPTD